MHLTRRELDEIASTQPASLAALRDVPGWGPVADAYERLAVYRAGVETWSEQQAEGERDQLRDMRSRAEAARDAVTGEVARLVLALGLDPGERTITAIEEQWPAVLDLAEREQRELDLLGSADPAAKYADAMRARGMVVNDTPSLPIAETARQIRAGLLQARRHQSEVDEWDRKIDAVDPYEIDAQIVGWWNDWGRAPRPDDPTARPILDPRILQTIQAAGIDLAGDRDREEALR